MKIAVFGTGGVGGYFGALLAHAGHEVAFIARGEHLAAMQAKGLQINSPHGDFHLEHITATDEPGRIGPVEYVVVAVKHYHLEQAVPELRPLVGEGTMVVPLLNGVDAHEYLLDGLDTGEVVGGLCSISTMIEAPGVIHQVSQLRRIVVGELDREPTHQLEKLVEAWSQCGVETIHSGDIFAAMWTKFLFIASFGCVSSLTRASAGEILQVPETRSLLVQAMQEVYQLAEALEIHLAPDAVEKAMALMESFEPGTRTSMQRDVEGGRPFELEAFSGKIVQLARDSAVELPAYEVMDALLRPVLAANQGG